MTWNQLDGMGKHVPVPADYVLSWSFKNPDPPIREASKTITLTDQVQSQLEAFSASAFRFLQDFPPVVWFCGICRNDSVVPGVETDKDLRQTHDVCACCSIGNRNPHPHPRVLLQPAPLLGDSMSGDNLPPQQDERLSADHSDNLGNPFPSGKNGPREVDVASSCHLRFLDVFHPIHGVLGAQLSSGTLEEHFLL